MEAVLNGQALAQETRRFDAVTGSTVTMRTKENEVDYRCGLFFLFFFVWMSDFCRCGHRGVGHDV